MRIIHHQRHSQLALPRDFAAFLNEIPNNFEFTLDFLQGALRFTRDGIPTAETFESELKSAQELGLIRASYEVFKGEGELVLYCEHIQTVKYKNVADFAGKTEQDQK